jgi:Cof subfamily protein (haloacid dehalogenase superfamily)
VVTLRGPAGGGGTALGGVRLVATDLDGTVVRRDGTLSARVLAALDAVEDAGVPVVFVTGRPPRWMRPVVEQTGHRGLAVCANGAYVFDLATERVVERFLLAVDDAREAVRQVRAVLPDAVFAVERHESYAHEAAYTMRWESPEVAVVPTADDLLDEPVGKLLVRVEDSDGDAMLTAVTDRLAGLVTVTHSNQRDSLLEISARGVTKASTLERLAAERGIVAAEVVAFGDQPNDVPMLAWAGTGYAMADGHPAALAAVSRQARSVDEDGVALVLEQLLTQGTLPD